MGYYPYMAKCLKQIVRLHKAAQTGRAVGTLNSFIVHLAVENEPVFQGFEKLRTVCRPHSKMKVEYYPTFESMPRHVRVCFFCTKRLRSQDENKNPDFSLHHDDDSNTELRDPVELYKAAYVAERLSGHPEPAAKLFALGTALGFPHRKTGIKR